MTQPVCDLACQSGYSPSNTEPPTLHCNITGGEAWSHFTCDENTCDALTLPLGVVAAVGSNSSCTNGAVLTAVNPLAATSVAPRLIRLSRVQRCSMSDRWRLQFHDTPML